MFDKWGKVASRTLKPMPKKWLKFFCMKVSHLKLHIELNHKIDPDKIKISYGV